MGSACSRCAGETVERASEITLEDVSIQPSIMDGAGGETSIYSESGGRRMRTHMHSQHMERLPAKYVAGQEVIDNSNSNATYKVFSNNVSLKRVKRK
jgi:hypothetical protein